MAIGPRSVLAPSTSARVITPLGPVGVSAVRSARRCPSRTVTLWHTTMAATAGWFIAYAVIVAQLPNPNPIAVALSLAYVAFHAAESLVLTWRFHRS